MKAWLRETHGPSFELLRHFLRRFFESDLITTPGEMIPVLIGILPVCFQWFLLLISPLRHKYAYLNQLAEPGPYRQAVQADELWLITLMMSTIGLLTAIKWHALFPDLRDYRVLGTLPLTPRQIFGSKLAALLLVASAALVTVNLLPSTGFPALSSSRWALQPSLGARTLAHVEASLAGCAFFFFGLVALQGILLNVLPSRAFGRVAGYAQGCLVGIMLSLAVLSFSIQPQITRVVLQAAWGRWLPPVWFLGLYQDLTGVSSPGMRELAGRANIALAAAVALALLSYVVSYHRHRALLMEGLSNSRRTGPWRWRSLLLNCISRRPRQQAVTAFVIQTLGRSNHHRTILMGYGGLGFALLLTGVASMSGAFKPERVTAADFVYYHILALLFLLVGARHVFSHPVELKANWIFQIMEGDGRSEWMRAVDRLVLVGAAAPLLLIPLPAEIRLLGPQGIAEAALVVALGLLSYEWTFFSWRKLPFTCSHLPGKLPVWMILAIFGLVGALGLLHSVLMAALDNKRLYATLLAILLVAWLRTRYTRHASWPEVRLKYEEAPEPAVHSLNLLK